ncbi:S-layer homology domain-containing protein [Pelotomaculum terephthalicicum JT]|uniref:S-layer homology domain-containing protein n=1 Tax=Pelotomaculum terephthalicicum TaxID=206393 RepID=UPI001F03CEB3|nr:S-layer homology domain-containing protein [Pelotomaculum terephthalicicum]MCG9967267.1 S-layer homology domain-containing protein [Pelotomaculum terephthalicicum JT]
MMKLLQIRKKLCVLMILAILSSLFGVAYADSGIAYVNLTSPQALQVYGPGDTVEISGTAQNLVEVSVAVRNAQGVLVFGAQPKVVNGTFATSFTLESDAATGKYTFLLGGLGLSEMERKFVVGGNSEAAVALAKPAADEEFKAGDVVEIAGTTQQVSDVAINVRNGKNGRVYVAQPPVVDGGFATRFTLDDGAMAGDYAIAITGAGLAAAQTSHFTVISTGEDELGEEDDSWKKPNAILFITGNGVSKKVSFTRAELEAMDQERVLYSTTSDMPQDKFVAAEGVSLKTLLNQAGMSGARMITFQGSDGYTISFTADELLNTTRYKFPGQTEVKPIIALKRVEGSANFGYMSNTDTPVLCYGQRAQTEQTLLGFVKRLENITVTTSSPDQWAKPSAKIVAPDSSKKVDTQSGEVESGSKVYLETVLNTNIYYTTDGTTPSLDSKIFNPHGCGPQQGEVDPIIVNTTTTVKAKAVGRGKRDSDVLSLEFTVPGTLENTEVAKTTVDEKNIKRELINLENGRKGEKITLLAGVLEDIEKGEPGGRLTVTPTADVDEVSMEVPAAVLQKAQEKGMLLEIDSLIGNYTLPLDALNLDEIAAGLGVKPEELSMNIVVSKATEEMKNTLAAQVREGQQMLVDPVEFTVEITAPNGKKVEYKSFGGKYVERELTLGDDLNVNQATGVLWNEAKGAFSPVPTRFETRDGKNIAVILNRTNSLYTVLQSAKTFADIQDNWAKADIELLAAKMLIAGQSENIYEPDSNVTRAEFAALLVRALGLEEGVLKAGQFQDVAGTDWYAGSVAAATAEGIIKGYDDNLFKPDANITREEMTAMIARAARVAGKEDAATGDEQEQLLAQFKDKQLISAWASGDVALAARAGIVKGMPDGGFAPQAYADRAQSAAILKRFLIYVNFITTN